MKSLTTMKNLPNIFLKSVGIIACTLILSCSDVKEKSEIELRAVPYDSHVELQWSKVGEDVEYKVYAKKKEGSEFLLRTTTSDTIWLDFVKDLGKNTELVYKIEAEARGVKKSSPQVVATTREFTDEELLDMVQYYTFRYFWHGAEPNSGLARERYHMDGVYPQNDKHIITTGGSGFGLFSFPAAIQRGWITNDQALARLERILTFLETADKYHGVWPHWLNGETGRVQPFSPKDDGGDLVESAFLIQGLLAIRQHYINGNEREKSIAQRINALWEQMEWDWYRQEKDVLYWHWSPNFGWEMNFPLEGYNECLITYVLAAASPTYPISDKPYHVGWARNGAIKANVYTYGYDLALRHNYAETYGGPLFWSHYSFLGLNPSGLKDRYADYMIHNTNHTLINRQWCIENPENYKGYGEDLWGLTSSYSTKGYAGHKPTEDLGVISPTAALSSIVYTPEASSQVLINMYRNYGDKVFGIYGFYDAFSVTDNWYPKQYLAIDQGPIVTMIENYRSGSPWKLFMSAPEVQNGLKKLGFEYKVP